MNDKELLRLASEALDQFFILDNQIEDTIGDIETLGFKMNMEKLLVNLFKLKCHCMELKLGEDVNKNEEYKLMFSFLQQVKS